MSKITKTSDFGRIKDFAPFASACSSAFGEVVDVVNGNIDFSTNIDCVFASFSIVANVEQLVPHTLGRVPIGKIVIYQTCNQVIYDSTSNLPTDQDIHLWCTDSGNATIILF